METQRGKHKKRRLKGGNKRWGCSNVRRSDSDTSCCQPASCFHSFWQTQQQKLKHPNRLWVKENHCFTSRDSILSPESYDTTSGPTTTIQTKKKKDIRTELLLQDLFDKQLALCLWTVGNVCITSLKGNTATSFVLCLLGELSLFAKLRPR